MPTHAHRGPKTALVIIATLALVGAAACSKDKTTASGGSGGSASSANAAILGTPNKATGTPIKVGLVNDGKTDAIDNSSALDTAKAVAQYANDYLGGLNGHPLEVDGCETKNTPAGGTTCGVQMINDKVAAVLVGGTAQDGAIFNALSGSGIPYITDTSATGDILTKPGAFVLTNPIGAVGAPIPLAQSQGVTKAAFVVVDVPAASGISQLAKPLYSKAGIQLDLVLISPQTADMTPQIQQALSQGDGIFALAGLESFDASAIKALHQAGFTGDIVAQIINPKPETIASIPGGFAGVTNVTANTDDPNDPDVQLFNAIMDKYSSGTEKNVSAQNAFAASLGFIRALTGVTSAVDAPSITAAMSAMPKRVPLPLGGGITIQCGTKAVSYAPNICTTEILQSTLDANGQGQNHKVIDVSEFLKLG